MILVSHQTQYLEKVDKIIVLESGSIFKEGTFEKVTENGLIDLHKVHHHRRENYFKKNSKNNLSTDRESNFSQSSYSEDFNEKSFIKEDDLSVNFDSLSGK